MLKPALYIAISVAALFTGGCVSNRPYRLQGLPFAPSHHLPSVVSPGDSPETGCRDAAPPACVKISHGTEAQQFYLAYIEFDDMGEMWSIGEPGSTSSHDSQLDLALHTIAAAKMKANCQSAVTPCERRELVVITFIHGWHNNASPYDEKNKDLAGFKTILQKLIYENSLDYPRPPIVVGIFLSWRGQAVAGDQIVTYWNRRNAATRIGSPAMTEVVTRLMFQTKGVAMFPESATESRSACSQQAPEDSRHARFIVIGHSFGARALEHAVEQPLLSMMIERQLQSQECTDAWNLEHPQDKIRQVDFPAPADLIVFLNAANDALGAKQTIEAFKRLHLHVSGPGEPDRQSRIDTVSEAPFMISITSDGDWATEIIMPVAQTLSIPGQAFRKYEPDECKDPDEPRGDFGQLCAANKKPYAQSFYYTHSAASIRHMRSHTVLDEDLGRCSPSDTWPYFSVSADGGVRKCYCIDSIVSDGSHACPAPSWNRGASAGEGRADGARDSGVWNRTPYFVMSVPSRLRKKAPLTGDAQLVRYRPFGIE